METIADIQQLPDLGEETIHIWSVHVPDVLDRLETLHGLLSEKERQKAARFHREADRQTSIAARGALRVLLSGYTGMPATEISFEYSGNGKPSFVPPASSRLPAEAASQAFRLPSAEQQGRQDACDTEEGRQGCLPRKIAFNVSHSGDWAVLAFGRNRQIGIDIEKIKREMDVMSIASRYFVPEEIALIESAKDRTAVFFQLWARKEAYVKACGSTLFQELGYNTEKKEGWVFRNLEVDPGYAAAIVSDKELANVLCHDFGKLAWHGHPARDHGQDAHATNGED